MAAMEVEHETEVLYLRINQAQYQAELSAAREMSDRASELFARTGQIEPEAQPIIDELLDKAKELESDSTIKITQAQSVFLTNFLTKLKTPNAKSHPLITQLATHYCGLLGPTE